MWAPLRVLPFDDPHCYRITEECMLVQCWSLGNLKSVRVEWLATWLAAIRGRRTNGTRAPHLVLSTISKTPAISPFPYRQPRLPSGPQDDRERVEVLIVAPPCPTRNVAWRSRHAIRIDPQPFAVFLRTKRTCRQPMCYSLRGVLMTLDFACEFNCSQRAIKLVSADHAFE